MRVSRTEVSCGVHQLSGLYDGYMDPSGSMRYETFDDCIIAAAGNSCAFIIFSDHEKLTGGEATEQALSDEDAGSLDNPNHRGRKLAALIEEHKLGSVTKSGWAQNPNSRNMIQVYVWQKDQRACRAYAEVAMKSRAEAELSYAQRTKDHIANFASRVGKSISMATLKAA